MEGWLWKILCNEAPFRFGARLDSALSIKPSESSAFPRFLKQQDIVTNEHETCFSRVPSHVTGFYIRNKILTAKLLNKVIGNIDFEKLFLNFIEGTSGDRKVRFFFCYIEEYVL